MTQTNYYEYQVWAREQAADLPGMSYDSDTARFVVNGTKPFDTYLEAKWYYDYIYKFGGNPMGVNGYLPGLGIDFKNSRQIKNSVKADSFSDVVTHAATSNATMTDSDGLLKWAPHNLLTYSEQFDNAAWTKTNATVTANATTAPDGTATADEITTTGTFGTVQETVSLVNVPHTFAVWIKAGTSESDWSLYDASDGTTIATITPTSDWQLLTGTWTPSTPNSICRITDRDNTNTGTIYVWGAHLYRSDLGGMVNNPDRGDSYVPTTSAAVYLPRRGHHIWDGSAWVDEGLLHESEARTNLVMHSEDRTNAGWNNTNVTVTDDGTSIIGLSASKITFGSGSNLFAENVGAVVGDYVTLSAFVARGDLDDHGSNHRFGFYDATATADVGYINFNYGTGVTSVQSGTVFAHDAEEVDGGWRIHMTIAHTTGNTLVAYFGAVGADAGTGYFYLAGPQVE